MQVSSWIGILEYGIRPPLSEAGDLPYPQPSRTEESSRSRERGSPGGPNVPRGCRHTWALLPRVLIPADYSPGVYVGGVSALSVERRPSPCVQWE